MAFIRYVEDSEATPDLKQLYDRFRQKAGYVANILRIHGLNPPSLEAHFAYYRTVVLAPSLLSRAQREMIAVVVSSINECHYWLHHHGVALRQLTKNEALVAAVAADYRTAPITAAEKAMLAYVERLTRTPASVTAEDVNALRQAGFDDAAILDICQVAAYFAFVNRMADGLGVELEAPST